jgi:hypothetical protein
MRTASREDSVLGLMRGKSIDLARRRRARPLTGDTMIVRSFPSVVLPTRDSLKSGAPLTDRVAPH